jgi:hypothetical protein
MRLSQRNTHGSDNSTMLAPAVEYRSIGSRSSVALPDDGFAELNAASEHWLQHQTIVFVNVVLFNRLERWLGQRDTSARLVSL